MSLDQPACGEPVDAVRHGAGRHQRLLQESTGGQPVGLAGTTEGGEDVELPSLQPVPAERLAACPVEVAGQPGDPAQHLQRCDVEVRTLPPPRRDEVVDLVAADRCAGVQRHELGSIPNQLPTRSAMQSSNSCCVLLTELQ